MRYLTTALMYLLSLFATAVLGLFIVLIFAGPHSTSLSPAAWPYVKGVAVGLVIVLPVLAARLAWVRAGRKDPGRTD